MLRFNTRMPAVKHLLPLVLVVVCLSGVARSQEVQPNAPSSHEAFLKLLNASRDRSRKEIIARYDASLAASPTDHLTAIERCRFIAQSWDEDEDDTASAGSSCTDDLEERYGQQPAVVLYRLNNMWGDTALQYGTRKLADRGITFSASERATALGLLADRQHH